MMMMADFWQTRILGRLMVSSCMLLGGSVESDARFYMHTPFCTLDRRRLGLSVIGMLPALSASCVFPWRLHAPLPRIYNWLFSLISAITIKNCRTRTSTSALDSVLFLMRTAHARFLSDTRRCPMVTSESVCRTIAPESGPGPFRRSKETWGFTSTETIKAY